MTFYKLALERFPKFMTEGLIFEKQYVTLGAFWQNQSLDILDIISQIDHITVFDAIFLSPKVSQVLLSFTNVPITFRKREKEKKITELCRLNSTYFV